jgi:hypothetical protein
MPREEHPESAWNDGYDQAIEELMSEVTQRSWTIASDIMNKFPAWKAIVYEAREREANE